MPSGNSGWLAVYRDKRLPVSLFVRRRLVIGSSFVRSAEGLHGVLLSLHISRARENNRLLPSMVSCRESSLLDASSVLNFSNNVCCFVIVRSKASRTMLISPDEYEDITYRAFCVRYQSPQLSYQVYHALFHRRNLDLAKPVRSQKQIGQ
jgi:hypothetical protein